MPYKSQAQAGYFHTHRAELEKQGVNVGEWDAATKGAHLPKRVGYAKGGLVEKGVKGQQDSHEAPNKPSEGGVNDGHGIFAQGGAAGGGDTRWTKKPSQGRGEFGQFLGTKDRFTDGRKPAGFPEEATTDEDWSKPKGVGHTDKDDAGDCKTLTPVVPNKAGHVSYAKK